MNRGEQHVPVVVDFQRVGVRRCSRLFANSGLSRRGSRARLPSATEERPKAVSASAGCTRPALGLARPGFQASARAGQLQVYRDVDDAPTAKLALEAVGAGLRIALGRAGASEDWQRTPTQAARRRTLQHV